MNQSESKFKKGEIVNYFGNKAIIRAIKFNCFSNENTYMIGYFENGNRKGQAGVLEHDIKKS